MKKLTKMMAVIAALMVALSFAGCSDDDDDDGPSAVATYKDVDFDGDTVTVTFYDDATFEASMDEVGIVAKGTYTGDAKKKGEATMTHMMDDNGSLQELPNGGMKIPFTVENEKLSFGF
ncbi:MAG: hypothetical protein J6K96_06065 [Treponema sp.]|nr:hypothetical protein [Treponema sp.]